MGVRWSVRSLTAERKITMCQNILVDRHFPLDVRFCAMKETISHLLFKKKNSNIKYDVVQLNR